ncbi:MAG TPA: Rne/Rng family ribonuclease [Pseudolabrys sp.]|nr:Rne/Rng family ribonuclease [Pseudolabrys sp.]
MPNKMLIDAGHPEETRVVVLRGNRVEEFDFESANRKQLRGNIYLAKVTRVEPSLQAAFVDYGGNRHGFLAFSEIHPDYYQIPVADRQALIEDEARQQRDAEAEERRSGRRRNRHHSRNSERYRDRDAMQSDPVTDETAAVANESAEVPADEAAAFEPSSEPGAETMRSSEPEASGVESTFSTEHQMAEAIEPPFAGSEAFSASAPTPETNESSEAAGATETAEAEETTSNYETAFGDDSLAGDSRTAAEPMSSDASASEASAGNGQDHTEEEAVESVGGADALEEVQERLPRFRRQYKIQEVIKRRQVMLVQVVKEERGTKGAALTTYLSLAGRYSVLMPNTARGGGISRKITSAEDRNRLKEIAQELEVPEGMGVILRTAGASRTKVEVKRDFEYLLRLWEQVRDLTLKSTAPKLVYEEGSLTKRSIRDLYNKDIDEIIVSGEQGYGDAKEFMRMLMPSHAKHVKLYKDTQPIFTRFGIESQLDAMFTPVVQLRSGGYIVINQAEALVAIDVNSGRATREHHIEDTALKTNLEAAEEIARQLRLRDLAGLIVIDFIDMDESRNNRTVERRLKEALRHDRARIQVGRISHFGLLEMSRQRIRTSVLESSTEKCPICGGSGHVRSVSSVALQLLRGIEEMLIKGTTHNLIVRTRSEVALYVLNHKRAHLRALEERFRIAITVSADASVPAQQSFIVDRGEQVHTPEAARALAASAEPIIVSEEEDGEAPYDDEIEGENAEDESEGVASLDRGADEPLDGGEAQRGHDRDNGEGRRRRRRRRGRGRGRGGEARESDMNQFAPNQVSHREAPESTGAPNEHSEAPLQDEAFSPPEHPRQASQVQPYPSGQGEGDEHGEGHRRRRRGRRGGRRNRHGRNGEGRFQPDTAASASQDNQAFVQDFDQPPPPMQQNGELPLAESEREPSYSEPQPRAEPPAPAATAAAPASEKAPPRRRSTVREPAPFASSAEPSAPTPSPMLPPPPTPTPVVTSSESGEPAQPKRGWWGRRLLGGDKS